MTTSGIASNSSKTAKGIKCAFDKFFGGSVCHECAHSSASDNVIWHSCLFFIVNFLKIIKKQIQKRKKLQKIQLKWNITIFVKTTVHTTSKSIIW